MPKITKYVLFMELLVRAAAAGFDAKRLQINKFIIR